MVRRYYRGAERDLAPILSVEATRALGHEVKVGKVTLRGGYAYVDDVRIAEGRTLAERGPIATARQVVVDFDLRTILLTRTLPVPLFGNVRVIDPVAHAARDARGVWNFEDLLKTKPGAKQRSPVGHVVITNGTLDYTDAAFPRNPKRPATPVSTRFAQVNGSITFFADRSAAWDVKGAGADGKVQTAHVTGSHDPNATRLLLRVQATGFTLPLLARLFPPDVNVTTGLASGRMTLIRSPETVARKTGWPVDIQANASIAGATVVSSRFTEPASNINGAATLGNGLYTVRFDSGFAGSKLHAEGTILGYRDPALNGWATGSGIEFQRIVTALNLDRRYPALKPLRQVQARADIRTDVSGRVSSLDVRASGPATVVGALPGGATLPQSGSVQVAFSGPLSAPRVVVSGTLPRVKFRQYEATDVLLSGAFSPKVAALSFQGKLAGGSVVGRANFGPAGGRTTYAVVASGRHLDLSRLPITIPAGSNAAASRPEKLSGIANADLAVNGRFDQQTPRGVAEVQGVGLRYGAWEANSGRARLRIAGDVVDVEPLILRDEKGEAIVRGTVDTRTNRLDLQAEAERLDVARFAAVGGGGGAGAGAPEGGGKSKNQNPLQGLVYVRDGHITGTTRDPRFAGRVYAYDVQSDKYGADFAIADVEGSRDAVTIRDGSVYRFPTVATVSGLISRPFDKRTMLSLAGDFHDVEMLDLVELAGSDLDVSGVASGAFQVVGPARQPEITAPRITVTDARIGDYDFRSVTGAIRYDATEDGGTWHLDDFFATRNRTNPQLTDLTTITGSASIDAGKRFHLTGSGSNIDLDLLAPFVSDYVALNGTARVTAENITGALAEGKAVDLRGQILASTQGLTINGISLGDLHGMSPDVPAALTLAGETITSDDVAIGTAQSGITLVRRDNGRPALVWNRADDTLHVSGDVRSLEVEKLRLALAKSPYLAAHPDNPAAKIVGPTIAPLEGTLGGSFLVSGTTKDPVTDVSWFSENARIEGQNVQTFEGRLVYDRNRVTLSGRNGQPDATLKADETAVTAHGTMTLAKGDEQISADADVANLPLALLDRWFPGKPILRDLSGMADTITLQARGRADNPFVTASALVRDIVWVETHPITVAAPPVAPGGRTAPTPPTAGPSPPVAASQRTFVTRHNALGQPVQAETTGRELRVRRVEVSTVHINEPSNPNHIRAEDIHVTLEEQPIAPTVTPKTAPKQNQPKTPPAGPQPPRTPETYVIYGAAEASFDWHNLEALSDPDPDARAKAREALSNPEVNVRVRVPKQSLGLLAALTPTTRRETPDDLTATPDLKGTILANFTWRGTVREPEIQGRVVVDADHVRAGSMTTQLKNLRADLLFTGPTLSVQEFSTQTQVINPRTGAAVRTSDPRTPLRITGEIPLRDNVVMQPRLQVWPPRIVGSQLHVSGANLRVAEAPLPIIQSGRLIADDISADLDIGGTLFRPIIRGNVGIAQANFRPPDTFLLKAGPAVALAAPIFDMTFAVGPNVNISSAQLTATVHTEPGSPIILKGDVSDRSTMQVAGNLVIDKGTLNLPTARFVVQRGGVVSLRYPSYDFSGSVAGALSDPTLGINVNLTAVTRLTATSVSGARKRYTITVEARGPINTSAPIRLGDTGVGGVGLLGERSLQLTFRTDPNDLALTSQGLQQRIVGLLGGQEAIESIFSRSPDVGRLLRTQLTEALSNAFLPELFERLGLGNALGLEELSLDINQLNEFTLRITRQLMGPLYATYTRRLSGTNATAASTGVTDFGWEFKLSYRFPVNLLRTNLQFSYSIDDQRTNAYLLEGVYKF